jgi:hypothetical protein
MRKHPELTRAEAEWMAGETQAPYEVLMDFESECQNCQHIHPNGTCEAPISYRANWSGLDEDGECGCEKYEIAQGGARAHD